MQQYLFIFSDTGYPKIKFFIKNGHELSEIPDITCSCLINTLENEMILTLYDGIDEGILNKIEYKLMSVKDICIYSVIYGRESVHKFSNKINLIRLTETKYYISFESNDINFI